MQIINLRQRTPEWHTWRAQGVTASEAPVLLGRSPYKTPWQLWAERTGLIQSEDLASKPCVQRGIAHEDTARAGFEQRHQTLLLPLCAQSDTHPVLRCSLDGLSNAGEPVELKVPTEKTYSQLREQGESATAYQLAWCQLQFQLMVTEAAQGWLVFDPYLSGHPALEFAVRREDLWITETLRPACLAFWEQIRSGQAPPADPARDRYVPVEQDLATWTQTTEEYRHLSGARAALEAQLKPIKARQAELETTFRLLMGTYHQAEAAGIRVTRYAQRGTIDYLALLAKLMPDLEVNAMEAFRKPTSERLKVTLQAGEPPASGTTSKVAPKSESKPRLTHQPKSTSDPTPNLNPNPESTPPPERTAGSFYF